MKLEEVGQELGAIDYVTVSAAVKRFENRITRNKALRQTLNQARQLLKL